ncbi:scyllo-inositol 2-dehydrogenase (NAD(+)) [archaeon HR06]|nr:scyllo-inositol 2-dehydrogenase (NAD(+)) [archaeon HR06]
MVRIGVVGVGGWGKNYLRVLKDFDSLACFCDIDNEKIKFYSLKYQVPGYDNLEVMLRKENLDGLIISTPASTHYSLAKKALEYNLNLLIEKPMCINSSEAEELVEKAEEKGLVLAVGHIERFNPAVERLKDIIERRELGELLFLEFHRESSIPTHIKDVGIVFDTTIHDIDTARWLFKDEPYMVFSKLSRIIKDKEDTALVLMSFNKGKTAFLSSNWITPRRVRQLFAIFEKGIITLDFISQEITIDFVDKRVTPREKWEEPLVRAIKDFLDAVEKKGKPKVDGREGLKNVKIAEAIIESSKKNLPIYL